MAKKTIGRAPKYALPKPVDSKRFEAFPLIKNAFFAYINHLKNGGPDGTFYYRDAHGNGIGAAFLSRKIKEFTHALPMDQLEEALVLRYRYWVDMGMELIQKSRNPMLYLTFMGNLFKDQGWDKTAPTTNDTSETDVRMLLKAMGVKSPEEQEYVSKSSEKFIEVGAQVTLQNE